MADMQNNRQSGRTMMAIRLTGPCTTDQMKPVRVPRPTLKPGFVLIRVKAFGINESETISRKGQSDPDFTFPRVLGIEGVGVVEATNPASRFHVGQPVAAMMAGMGREYDGSYAQEMCVREKAVIPLDPDAVRKAGWATVGAAPEMTQTAYGTLRAAGVKKGGIVLVHGGTSNVGLMCIILAKQMGATVIATSRRASRFQVMKQAGADHTLVDDKNLIAHVRQLFPQGIDSVAEFVGIRAILRDMTLLKKGGKACFTGSLDGVWTIDNFTPFLIPKGTYLTSYAGEAPDLPTTVLNNVIRAAADGRISLPIAKVYHGLAKAGQAQANLESYAIPGKHVVVLDDDDDED